MLLRQGQELFPGFIAKDVRDKLRKARRYERFFASAIDDNALLQLLEDNGHIKHVADEKGERLFEVTGKGARLCAARVGKPLPRARAETLLQEVLDRAKALNEAPGPITIESILVFGSYLDASVTELGDLDLAVATRRRPDADRGIDIFRAHDRAMSALRKRSPYLGLCGPGIIENLRLTHRQVFPVLGPIVPGAEAPVDV